MGPKWSNCPEQKFFGKNNCYYFHLPIGPFYCVKFKEILTTDPEVWQCTIFGPKMVPLYPIFCLENYYYHSHLPINPFHSAKFKKNSSSRSRVIMMCKSRVMRMCNFWVQDCRLPHMTSVSENLITSLVSFIHAYLHAKNSKSQKRDINPLVKYWWLKNT